MKHLKWSMKQKRELIYNCSVEAFCANLGRLVTPFANLKIWKSAVLMCMESLCSRIVSLYLQIPSRFWINERMNKRSFIYSVWTRHIIRCFCNLFSIRYNTDNISVIQKFITHALKMRKQKLIGVAELSQNYTTVRYHRLVWSQVIHSLKGQFSSISLKKKKAFLQPEIKSLLTLSLYICNSWEWLSIPLFSWLLLHNMLFINTSSWACGLLLVLILSLFQVLLDLPKIHFT